jgi:uncharacterized membrane protein
MRRPRCVNKASVVLYRKVVTDMPISPLRLLALTFLLGLLMLLIQVDLLAVAFDKLGLSPVSGMLLLTGALVGSMINLPVMRIRAWYPRAPSQPLPPLLRGSRPAFETTILIAVNAGGCIIPVCFSIYLMLHTRLPLAEILLATVAVSIISYSFSRPVPQLGIAMPPLVAPLSAAIIAVLIDVDSGAPLAYISGTLGVLIGADLMRINDVRRLGTPLASIGGAGTFDGIFITGIVAALLA